ncbi:MAG TPA: HlyD family secretion protein [Polyangia bacterium]
MGSAKPAVEEAALPRPDGNPSGEILPLKRSILQHSRLRRVMAVVAAVLAGLFGLWWFHFRPFVSTDDARVAAPIIVIAPQGSGGRVDRVLVREGQTVKAGETLVELDAAAERSQVDKARALVALADARVGESEAQLRIERRLSDVSERRARASVSSAQASEERTTRGARAEEIEKARADVAAAKSLVAQAHRDLDRAETLARDGAIAQVALETARTGDASTRAALESKTAALDLLEHGSRPEDISIAQSGVVAAKAGLLDAGAGTDRVAFRSRQVEAVQAQAAQARADLKLAEVALARMTLTSSVDGVIVRVTVDPGDYLSPAQGAVTIVDLAHAWIAANVEETASGLLRLGQPVAVSIDEGGELTGRVDVITQSAASSFALIPADNAAGNYTKVVQRIPIRVAIDPSPRIHTLRAGQSVEVRIQVR